MSHLGDLLSALVDGELGGAELDRASAHLAACPACRAEAAALRELKLELRALTELTEVAGLGDITRRLLALADEPVPAASEAAPGTPGEYGGRRRLVTGRPVTSRRDAAGPHSAAPHSARPPGRAARRRGRYVLLGTVSLVVVGIGGAAFGMGGGDSGPQVTPQQIGVYDAQHALTSGDVPFGDVKTRIAPAVTAHP
jgi:anti-sigma factor RsiW